MNPLKLISREQIACLPPTEYLGNTKFISRGFNVVFGPSGVYKSFYVLGCALTLARTAPVVYVAAEGAGGLDRRLSAWSQHYGESIENLHFICQEVNLLSAPIVKSLITLVKPLKPQLIVFDTLARCLVGGDENSARDMGVAIQNTAIVQREVGCASTWVHHSNRAERGERGSGSLRGAADSMIEMTASGDGVIRVSCSKVKDDEAWPTNELRFFSVGSSGVLIPSDAFSGSKFSPQEMQILEMLALEVFEGCGARATQISNTTNIPERSLYRVLSNLERKLTITHGKRGDPYTLTDEGRALVRQAPAKKAKILTLVDIEVDVSSVSSAN
jgi:predicted transcriptional regulator